MKVKALLLTCALAGAAFGLVQDTVQFSRAYKVGEKDKYTFKATASLPMGDAQMNMVMNQEVAKVYENGDADIKTSISDFKVALNGTEMPAGGGPGGQTTTIRVNKFGVTVNKDNAKAQTGMGGMDQLMGLASMLGDKPMKIGQSVPVNVTDPKDPKSKVSGTMVVESITEGVAKIVADMQISNATTGTKPMNVKTITWIEVATSKMNKSEGTVTNLPAQGGMEIEGVKFSVERAK